MDTKIAYGNKRCKQCLVDKPLDEYALYAPRGKGIYNTKQGHHTICKACESINAMASTAERRGFPREDVKRKLVDYYKLVPGKLPAVGNRLLCNKVAKPEERTSTLDNELDRLKEDTFTTSNSEISVNYILSKLNARDFDSPDDARDMIDSNIEALKSSGLYAEAMALWDEWDMED